GRRRRRAAGRGARGTCGACVPGELRGVQHGQHDADPATRTAPAPGRSRVGGGNRRNSSVSGGLDAPATSGGDVTVPSETYARQLSLPRFGVAAQRRLAESTVLIAGVGGLGGATATYLAAAGVGRLVLFHPGRLERAD